MRDFTRRDFLKLAGTAGAASVFGALGLPAFASAKTRGRVIVVGGGFGGASCANYIRRYDAGIQVTLIEQREKYITCPFSNTVLAGLNSMDFITHGYEHLRDKRGVEVVHDTVMAFDPPAKKVALKGGKTLGYDRLVIAPGIAFRWDQIEGLSEAGSEVFPHAWQAGEQTVVLRDQLLAMRPGGVFIIVVPAKPFRAPPAPYERASLVAHYLKENKSRSKVLILDAGERSAELALFEKGWQQLYPGMIEWVADKQGGRIARVDTKERVLYAHSGQTYKGDVINLIPPQQAGTLTKTAGLVNANGWCTVDQRTFESVQQKEVHILGDACDAGDMPKIAHAACSQAQICAAAIVSILRGEPMPEPIYNSTIYSLIGPKHAISAAAVYRLVNGRIQAVHGGLSPEKASARFRAKESTYAHDWYQAVTSEAWAL